MTRLPMEALELILYASVFIWIFVAIDLMIYPPKDKKDDK